MQYNVEYAGVIEADTEADANNLSEVIAQCVQIVYKERFPNGPLANIDHISCEVVIERKARHIS